MCRVNGDLMVTLLQIDRTEVSLVVKFVVQHHWVSHPVSVRDGNVVQSFERCDESLASSRFGYHMDRASPFVVALFGVFDDTGLTQFLDTRLGHREIVHAHSACETPYRLCVRFEVDLVFNPVLRFLF